MVKARLNVFSATGR